MFGDEGNVWDGPVCGICGEPFDTEMQVQDHIDEAHSSMQNRQLDEDRWTIVLADDGYPPSTLLDEMERVITQEIEGRDPQPDDHLHWDILGFLEGAAFREGEIVKRAQLIEQCREFLTPEDDE